MGTIDQEFAICQISPINSIWHDKIVATQYELVDR